MNERGVKLFLKGLDIFKKQSVDRKIDVIMNDLDEKEEGDGD